MPATDPSRPDPVPLQVGGRTLATAYARRPPAGRKGTEHWFWIVAFYDRSTGKPIQRTLGRIPEALVPTRLAEFYREVDPTAVQVDGSGVDTVGNLLRAY